jgi:hypothetical protein
MAIIWIVREGDEKPGLPAGSPVADLSDQVSEARRDQMKRSLFRKIAATLLAMLFLGLSPGIQSNGAVATALPATITPTNYATTYVPVTADAYPYDYSQFNFNDDPTYGAEFEAIDPTGPYIWATVQTGYGCFVWEYNYATGIGGDVLSTSSLPAVTLSTVPDMSYGDVNAVVLPQTYAVSGIAIDSSGDAWVLCNGYEPPGTTYDAGGTGSPSTGTEGALLELSPTGTVENSRLCFWNNR